MIDDERTWAVKRILCKYVKSPSGKHIRDPYSITKLAQEIVTRLDRGNVVWTKWPEHRDMAVRQRGKSLSSERQDRVDESEACRTQAVGDGCLSLTDPDARAMVTSMRGAGVVGHNVQAAVDTEQHLIVAHDVTNVVLDRTLLSSRYSRPSI
jgi:hypothetical protein